MMPTTEQLATQGQDFDWFKKPSALENEQRFSLAEVIANDPRRRPQSNPIAEGSPGQPVPAETGPFTQVSPAEASVSEIEEKHAGNRWQTVLNVGKKALHFATSTKEAVGKTAEKIVNNRIVRYAAVMGTIAVLSMTADYGISQAATGAENPGPNLYQKNGVGPAVSQQVATGGHSHLLPDFYPDVHNIMSESMGHATHFLGLYAFVGSLLVARSLRFVRDSRRQHKAQQKQILDEKQHGTYSNFVMDYFCPEV